MEEPPYEIKTLIHHVVHRHNIYKMEEGQVKEVLFMLGQELLDDPVQIQ